MTRLSVSRDLQRNLRKYDRETSVVFFKTKEGFGGLSNMAGGFPLQVNGIDIRSSEALYQACRFPHRSDLQSLIIEQKSPMTAKMKTKPYRNLTRPDWDQVRIEIMRWCLRVKLAQNWLKFSNLLNETDNRPIVEQSRKDDFWGAVPANNEKVLVGRNALGRLLMELREAITNSRVPDVFLIVDPINIPDFKLDNRMIERVVGRTSLASEPFGDVQVPMVETRDERAEQLGFNLNELASRPVRQVHEGTESNPFRQVKSDIGPYPEYRDSGMECLGKVPEHWAIRRLRYVADMRVSNVDKQVKDDENPVRLCNYVDVYSYNFINKRMDFMHATATNKEIERFRLERDDVLITKDSETWDDIGVPALVTEPAYDLISGYHLALLRPQSDKLTGGYLLRALQSKGLAYQFHVEAKGVTRFGLSHAGITSVWLPLPSLSEQVGIGRFLDHTDGCIQHYIQAKQKLLQLLEEQKQATIHQAITGNINVRTGKPYPVYKPSGVGWPGDVPEHWEVRRLKTLCSMKSGDGITAESIESDGKYPVYGGNGLRGFTSKFTHCGDFALIGRQGALCGNVHIARGQFYASEHAVVATLNPGYVLEWFVPVLGEMNLNRYSIAAAQPGLAVERILNLSLPVPPLGEQASIAAFIDRQSSGLDNFISHTLRQIDLIQEYRTRLIADVVTGKVDVRGIVDEFPYTDSIADHDVDGTVHDDPGFKGENQPHVRTQI